ncbi:hypothetical protein HPB47_012655 [Ixodes persulcatus]|uniref:Uncharacterized protein n=1 Tax=Ixodes persulcatus TaxID=34615 RepID=A0AC60NSV7_IXOPE|nr:hypothetical protein HPB47_012655 [Ixodes persulcatus]
MKEGDHVRLRKPTSVSKGDLSYIKPLEIIKLLRPGGRVENVHLVVGTVSVNEQDKKALTTSTVRRRTPAVAEEMPIALAIVANGT